MNYDIISLKGFPVRPEISLSFLTQGWIFIFLLAQKSQDGLNVNEITFWVLVFESISMLNKWFSPSWNNHFPPFSLLLTTLPSPNYYPQFSRVSDPCSPGFQYRCSPNHAPPHQKQRTKIEDPKIAKQRTLKMKTKNTKHESKDPKTREQSPFNTKRNLRQSVIVINNKSGRKPCQSR